MAGGSGGNFTTEVKPGGGNPNGIDQAMFSQPIQAQPAVMPITPSAPVGGGGGFTSSGSSTPIPPSPLMQQMNRQQFNPFQQAGLQAIMANFMNMAQPNRPMQQPMQTGLMPTYQNRALGYRPNYQAIQQNLSRVKPSVYKTELDDAKARIAELEAQLAPRPDNSGGGGG